MGYIMQIKTKYASFSVSPEYISGFTDGEGCFTILLSRKSTSLFGICITPSFSISQNTSGKHVLEEIQKYFKCGFIRKDRNTLKYEVRNFSDLQTKIRPHYLKYPLGTQKRIDFQLFCKACDRIAAKKIKNFKDLCKLFDIIYRMNNNGQNRRYSKEDWQIYCLSFEKEVKV
jgi:hypothetical protein